MGLQGEHTWDIVIQYHRCPECGWIIESREGYAYVLGQYQKQVDCDRCHHRFTMILPLQPSFGPLIGNPQPIETEWGS